MNNSKNPMRVLVVQRIFSAYKKGFFDRIANLCTLRLVHSHNASGIKEAETEYSSAIPSTQIGKSETSVWLHTKKAEKEFNQM